VLFDKLSGEPWRAWKHMSEKAFNSAEHVPNGRLSVWWHL
jgi:hypothetical protein